MILQVFSNLSDSMMIRKRKFSFATALKNGYEVEKMLSVSQNPRHLLLQKSHTGHRDPTVGRRKRKHPPTHTLQGLI